MSDSQSFIDPLRLGVTTSTDPDAVLHLDQTWRLPSASSATTPLVYASTTVEQFVNTAALSDFTNRYSIPAGDATVGKVYRLTVRGIVNNGSGSARTYTFAIRLGGVTIGTFTAVSLNATTANRGYEIRADLIVVSTGAGGTAELQGTLNANRGGTVSELENTARVTFDTTAAKTFGVAVTMSVANALVNTDQRAITVEALG